MSGRVIDLRLSPFVSLLVFFLRTNLFDLFYKIIQNVSFISEKHMRCKVDWNVATFGHHCLDYLPLPTFSNSLEVHISLAVNVWHIFTGSMRRS